MDVAVNVTGVPAQTEFTGDVIATLTESPGVTVTRKLTGFPAQSPIFGITWYVTEPGTVPEFNSV
jgi:hypothetical protein